jgi:hypothetical protein
LDSKQPQKHNDMMQKFIEESLEKEIQLKNILETIK